jgi:uncharacterized Ntn-hydrolase superfamily protein
MKVVVWLNTNNKILCVKSFDWYKEHKNWTDEKIVEAVAKANTDGKNESIFVIWEVDGDIGNLVEFLLGNKKYKIYSDIDDLDDSINELSSDLSSIRDDIYHMSNSMENIEEMFKNFQNNLNKKGYYNV